MTRINHNLPTTLLKTDRPVVAINVLMRHYLPALEAVLRRGVTAIADPRRSGFYELDTGGNWYYIHIPNGRGHVYLIAASRESPADSSALPASAMLASVAV